MQYGAFDYTTVDNELTGFVPVDNVVAAVLLCNQQLLNLQSNAERT